MRALTIDEMHAELHRTGWNLGEIAYTLGDRLIRHVDACRDDDPIVACEYNQTAVWRENRGRLSTGDDSPRCGSRPISNFGSIMFRFFPLVAVFVLGCSEPTQLVTAPTEGTVVAGPTATAEAPFTIDDAMTLPITQDQLVAALRAAGFPVTDPKPERGYNVSTVGMTSTVISFKVTGGKLRGVMVAAGKNGETAIAEQNAKLLTAVSALTMAGSRDEARTAVAASIVTAFGQGGDDPGRVISYSNSKATVRVRPMPERGLMFTITPNPERLLQVR